MKLIYFIQQEFVDLTKEAVETCAKRTNVSTESLRTFFDGKSNALKSNEVINFYYCTLVELGVVSV